MSAELQQIKPNDKQMNKDKKIYLKYTKNMQCECTKVNYVFKKMLNMYKKQKQKRNKKKGEETEKEIQKSHIKKKKPKRGENPRYNEEEKEDERKSLKKTREAQADPHTNSED